MPFRTALLPYKETGKFSRLFLDYTESDPKLAPFYTVAPESKNYPDAIASMQYDEVNRAIVIDASRRQYTAAGIEAPVALLEKFSQPGTLTVTTGHQLCLFTGPLYFVFKLVSTIRLAEKLEAETGKKVVPVYWMASEDHDFDEIASVNVFGKTLTWEKPGEGAVGKLPTDSLQPLLEELKNVMGVSENASKLHALFSEAYRPGRKLVEATRELVHRLFEGKLLILDGDDAAMKKLFLPVFRKDIFEQQPFGLVNETIAKLEKLGYEAQVNPREINVFYLQENLRARIEKNGETWKVTGTEILFSQDALEKELTEHAERFSPNVVLRPLYQQVLLPNLAYVGGPGELAYWLEYKTMFDRLNTFLPVLQPRNFALLVDKASSEKLAKLGLQPADLFGEVEEIVKRFVSEGAGDALNLEAEKEKISAAFATVIEKAKAADPTLEKNAEAELQKALNSLDTLHGKMLRAQKQKQENSVNQLRKLHAKFFPGGNLQERYDNLVPYYLEYGDAFIPSLAEAFDPLAKGLLVLEAKP